jgi:hypothetical protein
MIGANRETEATYMNKRILMLLALVTMIGVFGISAAGAQEADTRLILRGGVMEALIDLVTDETGLTAGEIAAQMADGQTLAQIIEAAGGDLESVIAQASALITERLETAVTDGGITQAQADQMLANLEARLTDATNGDPAFPLAHALRDHRRDLRRDALRGRVQDFTGGALADATGLTPAEIADALRSGSTVADLLEASGADVEAFVADSTARAEARLNVWVVDGRITQERADELLDAYIAALGARLGLNDVI